jgi:phosphatidylserine decarboxylase
LHGRRNPFVAQEGIAPLLFLIMVAVAVVRYSDPWFALLPAALFVLGYLVFRDPHRAVPSIALGVFSPVDGEVVDVSSLLAGATGAPALQVKIAIDSFGTYTARAPVEGNIKDLGKKALWIQTDEGDDVVVQFEGYRLGLAPKGFARFGERFGQGQRCAFLRLTRIVEIQWPADGKVLVEVGQRVAAGVDVIGNVPSPR